jgi:hypothetical protein
MALYMACEGEDACSLSDNHQGMGKAEIISGVGLAWATCVSKSARKIMAEMTLLIIVK